MDKKSKFRKILAATSALAVIVGASNAMAGVITDNNGGDATLTTAAALGGGDNTAGAFAYAGPVAVGDSFFLTNAGKHIILNGANIGTIDMVANAQNITIQVNSSIGSIISTGGAAVDASLIVKDGIALTLDGRAGKNSANADQAGGIFTGLGTIVLGHGAGVGTLNIDTNATFAVGTTIQSNQANQGVVNVIAGRTVTFNGALGGGGAKVLDTINLANGSVVNLNANANTNGGITLAGTGRLNVGPGAVVTSNIIANGGAGNGVLAFEGVGNGTVVGSIGNAAAITEIIANSNGVVTIAGGGVAVKAQTLTVSNALTDVRISANGLTGNTNFTANGLVKIAAGGKLDGAVTSAVGGVTGANGGKIVFVAAGEVSGLIGTAANRLDTVEVTGAGQLDLTANGAGQNHYARVFNLGNANSVIEVTANGTLHGDVVATGGNDEGIIRFLGAGGIVGKIGDQGGNAIAQVEANGAGVVNIGAGNHKITLLDLKNANSIFTFADGANVMGKIQNTTGGGAAGVVNFTGNGEITGTTGGAAGLALVTVNLNGDANSNVKFGDKITAANINTVNGGTLELNGVAGNDIVGSLNFTANGGGLLISGDEAHNVGVITTVGNVGTVEIKNTVGTAAPRLIKFEGKIGNNTNANALALFTLNSGANGVTAKFMTASTGSQITAIQIGAGGGTLEFAEANAVHKIGGITAAMGDRGTLKITNSTTFESAANNAAVTFGTVQERLAGVELANAQTLTVGDNIDIYATKLFGTGNGDGILSFAGSSTFSAPSVNGNAIVTINVLGGAGKIVKLLDVTEITGNATVADNGTLEISSNFTGVDIKGAGLNNGTVRFTNGAAMTVNGTVGAGNSLNAIEFAGGNVNFNGAVTHTAGKSFTFTDAINAAATVTFDAATDVGGNNFVNSTTKGLTHTVVLNKNLTDFAGVQLAADPTKLINFQLDLGKNVTLSGATVANGANFTTGQDTKGDLIFNTTNAGTVNSVGAVGKKLADVQFTKSMTVTNGLFATNVNVAGAQIATVGGRISGDTFKLAADASKVVLSDGAIVDTAITGTTIGKGLVEFAGNVRLNKDIGNNPNAPQYVTFADVQNVVQTLDTDNIYATNILLRKGKVDLNKNIVLNGATTANNTPFILHDKKLSVANGNTLAFSGDNTISLDVVVNGNVVTSGGQIASLGVLEYGAGTLTINPLAGGAAGLTGGNTIRTSVITSANDVAAGKTLANLTGITVNSPDKFIKWTSTAGKNGGLDIIIADRSEAALLEILGSSADAADKANIAAITNAASGTDGNKVRELLRSLNVNGVADKAKVDETFDRLPALTTVSDAVKSTASAVSMGMSQRMTNLAGSQGARVQNRTVASNGSASGIAAGDEGARYGVWASPFFGKTTQKENKGAAGYKSSAYGASFGFDTRANEDMIVGAAFTVANTEMKHRDFKSGDKTKISSMMFSIYGMQQITDNWFAHGVATFGANEVKNAEKRVASLTTYDTVNGKYNSSSFNGEVMFGYNALTEQVTFTPMAGLRYSRVNDGGYKEAGSTTGQNLDVNTKASNKLEVVAGVRVAGGTFATNGMTVTPEIHGFVNHDIIGKNPKQTLGLAGTNGLVAKSNKPVKTTFNLGLGVNAEYGMMEYGAGYDAEIATKRLGHQGTLKIRVNF
jgi:outer membrane autotransporter protein